MTSRMELVPRKEMSADLLDCATGLPKEQRLAVLAEVVVVAKAHRGLEATPTVKRKAMD